MNFPKWPFGQVKRLTPTIVEMASVAGVIIGNGLTVLKTPVLAAAQTLNVSPSREIEEGSMLLVQHTTNGTETLTFGTNIDGPATAGVAGKTFNTLFIYLDGRFVQASARVQID